MAILKIHSPIIPEELKGGSLFFSGIDGVSFKDVDAFVDSIPTDDNDIDIRLNCLGGSVEEGWAIVDKLRDTGKKISATIEGQCASMATVILLAASERKGFKHASLLIHAPYFPEYTLADSYRAEDLDTLAASLRADTQKILDFYVERTGADRAELETLMSEDRFIDMDHAKTLGFIQQIIPPRSAKVSTPPGGCAEGWKQHDTRTNHFKSMTKNTKNQDKHLVARALAALAAALGINQMVVNYELNTEAGDVITIDKPEGEDPAVGDSASPDGEHKMPDGKIIVIADGVITEIRDPEIDGSDEPEDDTEALNAANARIAELESQLATAQSQAKSTEEMRILNLVTIAGGVSWLERAKSEYKPAGRSTTATPKSTGGKPQAQTIIQRRLADERAKHAKAE